MRALIFGCPHVQPVTTLGSDALQGTVTWLIETARQLQVTHIICLGDTVESVTKSNLMVNLTVKWFLDSFKALVSSGIQVFWMIGNHDVYSEVYSALDIFDSAPNFTVVRQPMTFSEGGANFTMWPFQQWMDDRLQWPLHIDQLVVQRSQVAGARILLTHVPITGIPMGGTKDQGADMVELGLQYDLVIAGHYHVANQFMAQALSAETPVVVPGCVMAHDFKDLGWFHGAVLLDHSREACVETPTGHVQWLANPHSHYFYVGSAADLNQALTNPGVAALRERMHVRFTDKVDAAPYRQYGIPTVQVRPKYEQVQSASRQSFKLEGNPIEDLERWLKATGHESPQDLLAKARQYLA